MSEVRHTPASVKVEVLVRGSSCRGGGGRGLAGSAVSELLAVGLCVSNRPDRQRQTSPLQHQNDNARVLTVTKYSVEMLPIKA